MATQLKERPKATKQATPRSFTKPTPRTFSFKIEHGIPIPRKASSGRRAKYPFADMKPGDSIFLPGKKVNALGSILTPHRRKGLKFTTRSVDGGVRVWRVK